MGEHQTLLEKFQRDVDYAEAHREELLNQYPEQWVAILDQQVVGAKPDVYQLIGDLKARGIPAQRVVLRHLTRQEELLILRSEATLPEAPSGALLYLPSFSFPTLLLTSSLKRSIEKVAR